MRPVELANPVHRIVVVEGQQQLVAGLERIRFADQLQGMAGVGGEHHRVLVRRRVEETQDVGAAALDPFAREHRRRVDRVRVAEDVAREIVGVPADHRDRIEAAAGVVQIDLPLLVEPPELGRAHGVDAAVRVRRPGGEEAFVVAVEGGRGARGCVHGACPEARGEPRGSCHGLPGQRITPGWYADRDGGQHAKRQGHPDVVGRGADRRRPRAHPDCRGRGAGADAVRGPGRAAPRAGRLHELSGRRVARAGGAGRRGTARPRARRHGPRGGRRGRRRRVRIRLLRPPRRRPGRAGGAASTASTSSPRCSTSCAISPTATG